MARVVRGDIRWAELNPARGREQAGLQPILVLSQAVFNGRSGAIIAMAVTSQPQRAGFPVTHKLTSGRLPKRSWAKISQIRILSIERVGKRIGRAAPAKLAPIIDGLNEILGT